MFKYKVKDSKTGNSFLLTFKKKPTDEELNRAAEEAFGGEPKGEGGAWDAVKDYGSLFRAGFQKAALDAYAMGITRPAAKLEGWLNGPEAEKQYEMRAQGFSAAGAEMLKEAQEKADRDGFGSKVSVALGGMVPALGAGLLSKNPYVAMGIVGTEVGVQTAGADNYRYLEIETNRLINEEGMNYQEARDKAVGRVLIPSLVQGAKTGAITAAGGFVASKFGIAGVETGAAIGQGSRLTGGVAGKIGDYANRNLLTKTLSAGAVEGVEEGVDSLASSGIDWKTGFDPEMTVGKAVNRAIEDFWVGMAIGTGITGTRNTLEARKEKREKVEAEAAKAQAEAKQAYQNQRKELGRKKSEKLDREHKANTERLAREQETMLRKQEEDAQKEVEKIVKGASDFVDPNLPVIEDTLKKSAIAWARANTRDFDLSESEILNTKLSKIEQLRQVADLNDKLAEAQDSNVDAEVVRALEEERDAIASGRKPMHPPAVQEVVDQIGVDTVAEAYDILTGKVEQEEATGALPEFPEAKPFEESQDPEMEQATSRGSVIDLVGGRAEAQRQQDEMAAEFQQGLDRTPVEADPRLQSAAQAKAQRRSIGSAEQALGVTPKTSFAQAEASPDVLSPDVQDIKTEIPSEIPSAGFTQAEASAFAKQAAGKGFEMDRFERQARATALPKMEAAERRHTGTKTVYDSPHSPQKEAIISNAVELVDLTDADMDSTLVPNAIEQASQDAELAGTKLTVEDKLEILSRIDNKLDNEINSSGSVTIQDGLEAFAEALDKARKYVKKSTDKKIGANLGLITSQMKLALDVAILAVRAGYRASDVIDVGISNLKSNLNSDGMRLTDSRVDELIERIANYIVESSVGDKSKAFTRNAMVTARRSQSLKDATEFALGVEQPPYLSRIPKKGGEFDARANVPASLFGDISSEWEGKTSEASSVLTHIKKEFTEETSPSTEEISKMLLESSEDRQAETTKERIKTAKKWLDDIGARPENGTILKGRIDVPTFVRYLKYVNSINSGGKIIGYDNILTLDVVEGVDPFSVSKTGALNIAKGKKNKTKIAFVQGGFVNSRLMPDGSVETSDGEKISAIDLHDSTKYMQISMNPRRTDYFYDRSSGMRIKGAKVGTRIYQVGGTVFVRRKGGGIIQDRGNSTGMIARLKRLKGQTTKYLNQNRGRTSSLPVDVLIAQLANSSLSLTIEAVVYGKKTVDAAAEMAWNAIDKSKRILIDEKDFKSELIKRLKVALDIILDGNSTKAAVQQTKQAYSNLSMVDAEQADGVLDARRNDPVLRGDPLIKGALSSFKKQVKGREGVPVDGPVADPAESDVSATETLIQDMGIDIEAADAAPLIVRRQESWINKFIGGFLRGSLNTAAKAGSFGLNLLAQRSKIAINKRAYYEGRYRLLDEDGREIEVDEETEIEVDSYLRAKAARDNIRKKAVRKPLKPSEVKVYQTELPPISDKGLRLAQEIERVFEISGQDALAAGVMQKQSDGSYELGNFSLGKGGYFHAIKSKYLKAMRAKFSSSSMSNDQIADLKEFQEEQGLSDEGLEKLYNESTADPTAKVTSGSSTSKLSPMESPRRKELSLNVIDFTPSGFNSRMRSWAKRLSEIEAYGQDTDVNTNIFDLYIKQFKKDEYKHKDGVAELVRWLEDAKDVAYETPFGTKGGAGWATSAGGRFLNRSTSVLMLASFASMITQLTSIGFTASKAKRLGSFRSFIKGFLSAIASGDLLKGDAVRGLGLITGSMGSHQGFMAEDSPMSKASSKLADIATRAGLKGVAITDAISRTVSLHQSKALVEQVKDSVKEGINPDIVKSFGKHARRMGVNPEDVINGDPKAEAEYLIGSVFEVQGSYRLQQLPTLMRNPAWQSLLKFSPFAFQVGSEVAEQIRTTGEDGGAIGQTKYILWTAAIMGLTEEMRALAFEKLFGRERNVATLNEIMAQETFLGKANLSGRRVMADLIDVGILGQIGYMITGSRYARGDFSFSDLANLSVLDKGFGLASDYQQGKLTKDELWERFVRGNVKFMKDYWGIAGTSEGMRESYTYALKEQRRRQFYKLKNVAERYEADTGNRLARGSGEGTDLTKYKRAVSEQLLLGDIDKAREKAIEFAELSTDREKSWTVLTQSLKSRSPLQLIGLKSESDRQAFVNWASQNLTLEDQRDILEAHTEYIRTGLRSGLIRIQGEADSGYPDNVRQMKLMMTGKAPETTYSRPTLYRSGGSYKDLIRKHKADLNR